MQMPTEYAVIVDGSDTWWSLAAALKLGVWAVAGSSFHSRLPAAFPCTSAPPPVSA